MGECNKVKPVQPVNANFNQELKKAIFCLGYLPPQLQTDLPVLYNA